MKAYHMDAQKRAEEFFAKLILEEDSEIRNGCVYLIARVIHDGMEYQKQIDADIARKRGSPEIARAIENQITETPIPQTILQRLMSYWK